MTTLIDTIKKQVYRNNNMHDSIEASYAVTEAIDLVLAEVNKILTEEQGSMNQRADHAKHLAQEIQWKLTTDFPHLDK